MCLFLRSCFFVVCMGAVVVGFFFFFNGILGHLRKVFNVKGELVRSLPYLFSTKQYF